MIENGAVFAELRSALLSFYPTTVTPRFDATTTFDNWAVRTGSYKVLRSSGATFEIDSNESDLPSVFLAESELYLNHTLEQAQELLCFSTDTRSRSYGWSVVTAYYAGFFAVNALLRLLGKPVVFISPKAADAFSAQLRPGDKKIALGTVVLDRFTPSTAGNTTFVFRKRGRLHDAIWVTAFSQIEAALEKAKSNARPHIDEVHFFSALCSRALHRKYLGPQWPSGVRNKANYSLGVAYSFHDAPKNANSILGPWLSLKTEDLIRQIIHDESVCSKNKTSNELKSDVSFMVSVSMNLLRLATALHSELKMRRSGYDARWSLKRRNYQAKLDLSGVTGDFASYLTF